MGYCSDVRIRTSKKGYEELKNYVDKVIYSKRNSLERYNTYDYNLLNHTDLQKDVKVQYANEESRDEVYIGFNYVKWYDGYEDVDAIMDGLDHLEEKGYSYHFIRIGEDYDDIEEKYVSSSIENEYDVEYIQINRSFVDDF